MFKAILLERNNDATQSRVTHLEEDQLPPGEVSIDVAYSTLNYKDGMAITGTGPVVREWPMVPGIDLCGVVTSSSHADVKAGDPVIVNGWGLGETRWGGLTQKASVAGKMVVPLPPALTPRQAMGIGTAGYTAMLCVLALERQGITPDLGQVLVTGANGGVGSFAIALLSGRGYQVVASTGRSQEAEALRSLGACEVIDRATLAGAGKPLQKERWAAAIDTVGSHTLANICAGLQYGGVVAACGLAQGMDLPATVAPFILRSITLRGIDSVYAPLSVRKEAWDCLARELDASTIDSIVTDISLAQAIPMASTLMDGKVRGRLVVDVNR
jgi:acrylyl-CoA reductase (NADPH)